MKKTKKTDSILCGTPDTMREALNELDPEMKVVWTTAGFWAVPKK